MIARREVLDLANVLGLLPQVVEKDYVLGWVLAGIYQHTELERNWVFKGGTCLKKCYFETYRFSEDLDFTLTDPSHIDIAFLRTAFREVGEWVYERTGIEIPNELQVFEVVENPRGTASCQGKLSYRGPIAPRTNLPRIKLDLTPDELLVLPPVKRGIFHDYSDVPPDGISVRCYSFEEAFAEKIRALGDRARPRDLYDVINLYRNIESRPHYAVLQDVLKRKCIHRNVPVPTQTILESRKDDLEGSWESMLEHQLQVLPPLESYWNVLSAFFTWLETGLVPEEPESLHLEDGETVLKERTSHLPVSGDIRSYLEIIRFSASNHLCVDLTYRGSVRRIEPYSLRRTIDGHILLHAIRTIDGGHRSYRIDRILGVSSTNQHFTPRYLVELSPRGPAYIPISSRSVQIRASRYRRSQDRRSGGPRYVYECPYCGKRFTRKKMTSSLNPHKDKSGNRCYGRTATYIETRF